MVYIIMETKIGLILTILNIQVPNNIEMKKKKKIMIIIII